MGCTEQGKYILHYPVGVTVKPKVAGTKILFFKKLVHAEIFRDINSKDYNELFIVPCIAQGASKIKIVSNLMQIDDFWKLKKSKKGVGCFSWMAPSGTYGADSIKCLK
jgi:hypothetical protein